MDIKDIEWKITLENGNTLGDTIGLTGHTDKLLAYKSIELIADQMKRSYDKLKEEN